MTRIDALRALYEAVKAGEARSDWMPWIDPTDRTRGLLPYRFADFPAAYFGDLNAALALHEAVLPGWFFCIANNSAFVTKPDGPMIVPFDWDGDMGQYHAEATTPARAWLLAILAALIDQAEKAGKGEE